MDKNENERLKLIRKALGYSQLDFAQSIGLTQGGYSDIERGKNGISGKVKLMLINIHKVNISYLDDKRGEMFYIETPPDQPEVVNTTNDPNEASDTKDRMIELLQADIKRLNSERDLYIELLQAKDKTIAALERQLKK
ncbi:helix-turn-helix domain-containing protein [Pedobacter antarcticus]|uniref:helix-turn-helix domain-containing protein n=1 Tax=Pedobacter antarcticus TaxID=34086 RepID=UPI00088640D2|nr:helix-turn-helix domain-containing protein [Pedobacter antarcticus]SDM83760.1 DNA-binding transcriptional regulator, XRE-family HTH domain [Pedobacter antarcticus]